MATQENNTTVPGLGNKTQLAADQKTMHVDEVVGLFRCASDRFGELAALFDVLRRQHPEYGDMGKLAGLGRNIAIDYEEQCGCWSEQVDAKGIWQ